MKVEELLKTREGLYSFLSRMYLEEPPKNFAHDMAARKLPLPQELLSLNSELREGFAAVSAYMNASSSNGDRLHEDLVWEYTRLFIGPDKNAILPYESAYVEKNFTGKAVLEAKRCYRKAGLGRAALCREPEDHVALELDFMGRLCRRMLERLEAGEDIKEDLALQKDFLTGCLLKWVPSLCADIQRSPEANFYKGIARLTLGFLRFDAEMIDEIAAVV